MKIILPDSISVNTQLSGSTFLYFFDEKVYSTLHPTVSMSLIGMDPFLFYKYFKEKNLPWFKIFEYVFNLWIEHQKNIHNISNILEPLRKNNYGTMLLSYPKNNEAMKLSEEMIMKSGYNIDELFSLININSAADELMAHIFFEKYLEIYNIDTDKVIKNIKTKRYIPNKTYDYLPLFNYCNELFTKNDIKDILCKVYLFRFSTLNIQNDLLLSNSNMYDFIQRFNNTDEINEVQIPFECIAWEVFKVILSKYTDDLDINCIKNISKMLKKNKEEIQRLKFKCNEIAYEIGDENNYLKLHDKISKYIRAKVEKEISELIQLPKKTFESYLSSIFTDEKLWIALCTTFSSIITQKPIITASSAILSAAFLGPKTVSTIIETNKAVKNNDYALIYRLK